MESTNQKTESKPILLLLLAAIFTKLSLPMLSGVIKLGTLGEQLSWLLILVLAVYAKRKLTSSQDESNLTQAVLNLSRFLVIATMAVTFLIGFVAFTMGLLNAGLQQNNQLLDIYLPMVVAALALVGGIYFGFLAKKVGDSDE